MIAHATPATRSTARTEAAIARPRFFFGSGSGSGSGSARGTGGLVRGPCGGIERGPWVPGPDGITAVPDGGVIGRGGSTVVTGGTLPDAIACSSAAAWAAVGRCDGS